MKHLTFSQIARGHRRLDVVYIFKGNALFATGHIHGQTYQSFTTLHFYD